MKEIMAPFRGQVIITEKLASQISCLHNQCPKGTEWSGPLVYEVVEGNLETLEGLIIKAHAVLPMNFGTSGYTEYTASIDIFKLFDQYPQIDPMKKDPKWWMGNIHTHHHMETFFSATDTDDLHTVAKLMPMYLSLIVNYGCLPTAKIAMATEAEQQEIKVLRWKMKGSRKGTKTKSFVTTKSTPDFVVTLDVHYEQEGWFVQQLQKIKEQPVRTTAVVTPWKPLGQHSFDTKPTFNKEVKKTTYDLMMRNFSDLITLGVDSDMGPLPAFNKMDANLGVADMVGYKRAFKYYFVDTWFDYTYGYAADTQEEECIDCIEQFITYHREKWLYSQLKPALDELRKELPVLRTV